MSDYIKREDAKRAIRRNFHDIETRCMINNIINEVAKVSSDNLVEVVRCKDCKYAEVADPEDSQDGYICQFHRGCIWFSGSYCSWAERKES